MPKQEKDRHGAAATAWTRRQFLTRGAAGAALGGTFLAQRQAEAGRRQQAYQNKLTRRGVRHGTPGDPALLGLVERTSFGYTRDSYALAETMGFTDYLEYQLDHLNIDDSALDTKLSVFDTLTMSAQEVYEAYIDGGANVPVAQLIDARILRAVYSQRQLHERMVEFWTDHFNIDINDSFIWLLKGVDDRDVIRQNALSSFPDLLNASVRSAAMSEYLDNFSNVRGNAQENYARELMELHTLGVDNGYTQFDVQEVARCFTGWSYIRRFDLEALPVGTFQFYPVQHDNGEKTVLGNVIPAGGGASDVETVLDILLTHPNTAEFISRKMCIFFLGYDAAEEVIQNVAQTYLSTNGDIKSMLRVIFQTNTIQWLSTPKLKRPFHFTMSALRATEADVTIPRPIRDALFVLGQVPFHWPQPDGYPDSLAAWGTSLLPRWQLSSAVADNAFSGTLVNLPALLTSEGGDAPGEQAGAIDRILTGGRSSPEDVTLLQAFYDDVIGMGAQAVPDTFSLAASMPAFQWY